MKKSITSTGLRSHDPNKPTLNVPCNNDLLKSENVLSDKNQSFQVFHMSIFNRNKFEKNHVLMKYVENEKPHKRPVAEMNITNVKAVTMTTFLSS